MMKRSAHSVPEGSLPLTANDGNEMKSLRKVQNRRRPANKKTPLVRILGWTMLAFVVFLYVVGTRHVLLMTSSATNSAGEEAPINNKNNKNVSPQSTGIPDRNEPKRQQDFSEKPRVIGHYYALTDPNSFVGTERLDPNMKIFHDNSQYRIMRGAFMTPKEVKKQEHLLDSKSYDYGRADTMQTQGKDCVSQYDWQETSSPTCNFLMEVDHSNLHYLPIFHENHYNNKHDEPLASSSLHSYSQLIASGGWRDVWKIENFLRKDGKQEETFILKTMLYEHDYEARNYDRHRRDAVAMERLTSSKFIMDIYGFCGNSGLFQYADGGDLDNSIYYNYHPLEGTTEEPWSPEEKLVVAYQTVSGLADLHNFAKEGVPAVAHTDVGGSQFVYVDEAGVYKLNDFNRARFLGVNSKTHELCNYTVGSNSGKYRSPEEYRYDRQTEKVDIYSLGNIFFYLLTGKDLFYNESERSSKRIKKMIKDGQRSHIPEKYTNSTDRFEQTLVKAIQRSWIHDPRERATARELQTLFVNQLEKSGVKKDQW